MVEEKEDVRIDRWLFAVRLYKSRSLAGKAIAGGHVKIGMNFEVQYMYRQR